MRIAPLLTASLLVLLGACGDSGSAVEHDTTTTSTTTDATSGGDGDASTTLPDELEPDVDAPDGEPTTTTDATTATDTTPDADTVTPPLLAYERFGARIFGTPLALSRTGRTLWLGTRANFDYMDETETPPLHGGLIRYDLDTGATKVFDEDDLGLDEYDWLGYPGAFGPLATANVLQDGERVLAVAHSGLLVIDGEDVTPLVIHMPSDGPEVIPINFVIARDGLRPVAWMTSDQGLLRLDEDTFTVETVITSTDVGFAYGDFGKLTVDPDTGTVFASFFPGLTPEELEQEPPPPYPPSRIVAVTVTGEVTVLEPATNGLPSGRVGDLVWSVSDQQVYVALGAWAPAQGGVIWWNGQDGSVTGNAGTLMREGQLANDEPMGSQILALDDTHHLLAVGGVASGGPLVSPKGGGIAWVRLPEAGSTAAVVSTNDKGIDTPFVLTHVHTMQWDPDTGRLYAVLSDVCSETRLRSRGLFALSFDAGGVLKMERPLLSSVHAIADIDEDLYVGVREDNGAIACLGYPYNSGLSKVTAGGVGALELLKGSTDNPPIQDPGVGAIGGTTSDLLVLATRQDGFYVGSFEHGFYAESPAIYGPARESTDVLFDAATGTMWLAGGTTHGGLEVQWCEDDDPETMCLADRGPRGASRIAVTAEGVGRVQRFVLASDDPADVAGLPSGEVYDLLWGKDGSVLMACGTERFHSEDWDRSEQPLYLLDGKPRLGGVASVDSDDHITVLADATIAPDPRAIAWDPNDRLIIADATNGLFRLVDGAAEPIATPGLPAGAVPVMLWSNAAGDLVYGTSKGAWISWHGATEVLDDVGFVWSAHEKDGHLYLGTDQGLVVYRESTTPAASLPPRAEAAAIPF